MLNNEVYLENLENPANHEANQRNESINELSYHMDESESANLLHKLLDSFYFILFNC